MESAVFCKTCLYQPDNECRNEGAGIARGQPTLPYLTHRFLAVPPSRYQVLFSNLDKNGHERVLLGYVNPSRIGILSGMLDKSSSSSSPSL